MSQETYDFILDYLSGQYSATAWELAQAQSEAGRGQAGPTEAAEQMALDLQALASFGQVESVGPDSMGRLRGAVLPDFRRVPGAQTGS